MRDHARRNIRLLTWFNFCDDFRVYNAVAIVYFAAVTHSYALAALGLLARQDLLRGVRGADEAFSPIFLHARPR